MRLPDPLALVFLGCTLVLLPVLALRSRGVLEAVGRGEASDDPTRMQLYVSALVTHAVLLALAAVTGVAQRLPLFPPVRPGPWEVGAALAALAAMLVLMQVSDLLRSPQERKEPPAAAILPRTAREWRAYGLMCLAAGVAEEAAYRGVAVALLAPALGSLPAAVLLSATAFAVSHAAQGWKSGVIVFVMALVMHALVEATKDAGGLVLAMGVHALFDLLAGLVGARQLRTGQRENSEGSPTPEDWGAAASGSDSSSGGEE